MTYIEKLREMFPERDDRFVDRVINARCPAYFGINTPELCAGYSIYNCTACWNQEYIEPVPREFEIIWQNMIVYDAVNRFVDGKKMHMTVLERINHQYTKEPMYRIRRQSEEGWIDEGWYREKELRDMLEARCDE